MENKQLDFLDILSIISFMIQIQNQGNIIRISDVQNEVDRAVDKINEHLVEQDRKLNLVLEVLGYEDN